MEKYLTVKFERVHLDLCLTIVLKLGELLSEFLFNFMKLKNILKSYMSYNLREPNTEDAFDSILQSLL